MIAILRKNGASQILNRISFVCKSNLPYSLSFHFFSSLGETKLAISARIYDVMVHKHQFSPQVASVASSALSRCRTPEMADSMLSFLKKSGFSTTQLEKIVKDKPGVLAAGSEDDIKLKIKIFQDLGLSPEDLAKLISRQVRVLSLSAKNNIIPSLSLLKDLLGSNHDVVRLLRKSGGSILLADLKNNLIPNVEFLKSCGLHSDQILAFLFNFTRVLLVKPDVIRKSADKAKEIGFSQSSRLFIYAVRVFASRSNESWELKLQGFRNLGFSDSDILTMFRKSPPMFESSIEKIGKVQQLLLATGKYDIADIVRNPATLACSIEKRYKPRLRVLGILESKNLINKWPRLGTLYTLTDDKFFKKYIGPYSNVLGEEYVRKSYIKGKERLISK